MWLWCSFAPHIITVCFLRSRAFCYTNTRQFSPYGQFLVSPVISPIACFFAGPGSNLWPCVAFNCYVSSCSLICISSLAFLYLSWCWYFWIGKVICFTEHPLVNWAAVSSWPGSGSVSLARTAKEVMLVLFHGLYQEAPDMSPQHWSY